MGRTVDGVWFIAVALPAFAAVAAAVIIAVNLSRRFARLFLRQRPPALRWPRTPAQQAAIWILATAATAAGGVAYLQHLQSAAIQAAHQVRVYGYIVDVPDELDLSARPVTVRQLTTQDPLHLCSAADPVALTQLNEDSGVPVVLVRHLNADQTSDSPHPAVQVMRLPQTVYVVVQEIELRPTTAHVGANSPQPWSTRAC